ncbi:uncharacterized protein FFB20_08257 [Fusarium fujikuroi]|nr:uncharacterized protein FFB20_08257 [Fusarium fujikuroi]
MATFEVKDKSVYQKRFDRFRTHGVGIVGAVAEVDRRSG